VNGDPDYLQQVLLNLVGNAIKFSCSGGKVVVRVELDKDEKSLKFSVSDNGRGIPEEEQPLVFSKYYRVSGVGDQADGFGLGLSVSKQIVEVHGGDIWLESRLGQGSTFGFTIPLAPE
jgi:signal transduction histidine kinase